MKTPSFRFIFSILVTWLFIQPMVAQPPSLVNFRGQLLDNSNQPVTDTVSVGLKIFASETGGSALYTEEIGNIEVRNGQYAFQFGSAGTPDFTGVIQANAETWVEVSINNIPLSRQRFVSVPYALNAGSSYIAPGSITHASLSEEIKKDLNRSITRDMISNDLLSDIDKSNISLGSSLFLPFSSVPEVVVADKNYTIPENKVLVTANIRGHIKVGDDFVNHVDDPLSTNSFINDVVILEGPKYITIHEDVVSSTNFTQEGGFVGLLYDYNPEFSVILGRTGYNIPIGKRLVVTSIRGGISIDDVLVNAKTTPVGQIPLIIGSGSSITIHTPYNFKGNSAFTGYLIDANRSLGGGLISTGEEDSISTVIENGTITREMLDDDLRDDLNFSAFQSAHSLSNLLMPYGYDGELVVGDSSYTVPVGHVLAVTHVGDQPSMGDRLHITNQNLSNWGHYLGTGMKLLDENTSFVLGEAYQNGAISEATYAGFIGMLFKKQPSIEIVLGSNSYTVPNGKKLVITSSAGTFKIGERYMYKPGYRMEEGIPLIFPSETSFTLIDGPSGFSGYLIDENRSLGGGLISSTDQTSVSDSIENGSITRDKLSEEILVELSASVSEEELNSTISEKLGSIPPTNGQLLSVPSGTEPPLGYTKISDSRIEWKMESRNGRDGQLISAGDTLYSFLSNSLAYYDKNDSIWRSINAYPSSDHTDGAAIFFDGKIYAIGGADTHSCSIYDIGIGNWSVGPDIPSSLPGNFVATVNLLVINDQLYAFFVERNTSSGTYRNGSTAIAYKLGQSNSWIKLEIEDFAFISGGVAAHENKIFFFGGTPWTGSNFTPVASTNIFKCYDITTEEITSLSPLPQGVVDPSFFIINDHLYVLVGPSRQFFKYSFLDDEWNFAKDLPFNNNTASDLVHSATLFKGKVWLTFEGTFSGTLVPAVYSYSGGSDQGTNLSASTSVTPSMLSDSILKYLMPEIVEQPTLSNSFIDNGSEVQLEPNVEGKYLTYQWYKNGEPIDGATSQLFTIESFDVGYHDGNYTVVVTNDFGSVESEPVELVQTQQSSIHKVDLNSTVSLEMIWVEPGTFTIGSPESEAGRNNDAGRETQHDVTLTKGFYLGKYEVTQAQYEAVMTGNTETDINGNLISATPSEWPNNPNRPVEKVKWDDIQVFLTRLNAQEAGNIPAGWAYVLPTEAQWEYACRAGTTTAYSWGDVPSENNANWDHGNDANKTEDVGSYAPNPWGFYDMHGNVYEWTADAWGTYASGAQTDPFNAGATGSSRVIRGGSWNNTGAGLRSAFRTTPPPRFSSMIIGFRLGFQQVPADVASPEMSILGDANITHLQDTAWVDPGVEAHDVRDGNITADIVVTGSVDVNTTGTYTLTYTVSDAAGNEASITRTVNVGIPASYATDLNASVSLEMIWVEPGTFMMGSPETETGRGSNETQHEVTLSNGFYLGKYEVTQAQYEAVMAGNSDGLSATPSEYSGNPNRPVEKVSYNDVQVFLTRLNAQQTGNIPAGWAYVLPTEAQWEYACRAGTTTAYSMGNEIDSSDANYNWDGDSSTGEDFKQTRDVGQYTANPWGFFDMHGNVWEYVSDWYSLQDNIAKFDPKGPPTGTQRILRGGSWFHGATSLRSACRSNGGSDTRVNEFGFRLSLQKVPHVVDLNSTVSLEMIWVEPGTFTMGSPESEAGRSTSETQHEVTLTKGFYLGEFEVTQAQYEAVMAGNSENLSATPSLWQNNPNHPVEKVSYDDALVFLTRLNDQQAANIPAGWSYALPTEAQWEYACRAGTTTVYSWGDVASENNANWDHGNDANKTEDVGSYAPNLWGFYDMHGNVYEWTQDAFSAYSDAPLTNPLINSGTDRVHRGGSWSRQESDMRSAHRGHNLPSFKYSTIGFRIVFKEQ